MAESGANNFSNFWSLFDNVASVFSVFILAGLVPFTHFLYKKYKQMKIIQTNRDNDNIKNIALDVAKSIEDKLNSHIETQTKANQETVKALENLCRKLDDQNKQNRDILSITKTLTKDFHAFKDRQIEVNAKVDYMDHVFKSRLSFVRNVNNGDSNQEKYFDSD